MNRDVLSNSEKGFSLKGKNEDSCLYIIHFKHFLCYWNDFVGSQINNLLTSVRVNIVFQGIYFPQIKKTNKAVIAVNERTLKSAMEFSWSQSNNSYSDNIGASVLHFNKYFEEELNFWIVTCVIHAVLCFTAIFGNSAILITI